MTEMLLMKIGPDEAAEMLSRNTHNRRIQKQTVARYATDMAAGRWREGTAEPLAIDANGILQQGQHRLLAIQQSGVTLCMWVAVGTDPEDFRVLDQGKKRNASDVLGIDGFAQSNQLAALGRAVLTRRYFPDKVWTGNESSVISPTEVVEFIESNANDARAAVLSIGGKFSETRIHRTAYATVMFEALQQSESPEMWDSWHLSVTTGEMLRKDDPAYALRRFASKWDSSRGRGGTRPLQVWISVVSKAWNAYVADRSMQVVSWRRTELPMPEIAKSVAT